MRNIIGELQEGLPETESRIGLVQEAENVDIAPQLRARKLQSKKIVNFYIIFCHSKFYRLHS